MKKEQKNNTNELIKEIMDHAHRLLENAKTDDEKIRIIKAQDESILAIINK